MIRALQMPGSAVGIANPDQRIPPFNKRKKKEHPEQRDITGRVVLTVELSADKTIIDLSAFSAGVYTAVLLRDDVAVGRRKIIIE